MEAIFQKAIQDGMHGTPWDLKDRHYMNYPIYLLDRVNTPLLLEHGMTDLISRNNENVFVALRRLNKHVEYFECEHKTVCRRCPST